MKAIILTNAALQDSESDLIKKTDIFKIALNHHAAELFPHARIITDYILEKICSRFGEKIISIRDSLRHYSDRVEYPDIEFKGSTMVAAIDYLISENYDEILIAGDNKVHSSQFQNEVKNEIDKLKDKINIYQYSDGNFKLPVKTIYEFTTKEKQL